MRIAILLAAACLAACHSNELAPLQTDDTNTSDWNMEGAIAVDEPDMTVPSGNSEDADWKTIYNSCFDKIENEAKCTAVANQGVGLTNAQIAADIRDEKKRAAQFNEWVQDCRKLGYTLTSCQNYASKKLNPVDNLN
jgi:hypothetical protein